MGMAQRQRIGYSSLALLAVAFIAAVMASNALLRGVRVDLTENRLYTLSPGTRNILAGIEEPINLYLFFSDRETGNVPFLRSYAARVREMLEEFSAAAGAQLNLQVIDPLPFSEEEDRAALFGLEPISLGTMAQNVYFGLAGTNSIGDEAVIAFFQPDKEAFLEYDLARLIYSLATPEKPVIGLITGVPITGGFDPQMQMPSQPWMSVQQARQLFEIRNLPMNLDTIDDDIDVLWIVQPGVLEDRSLYAIDQFVMTGGRAIFFVDPFVEITSYGSDPIGFGQTDATVLAPLFDAWGLEFSYDEVVADDAYALSVSAGFGQRPIRHLGLIGLDAGALDQTDIVSSGLESLNFGTPGHFRLREDAAATLVPLVTSSEEADTMPAARFQFLPDPAVLLDDFRPSGERYVLAARLQGPLNSAFPDGPPTELVPDTDTAPAVANDAGHRGSTANANLILVGDVDVLSNRLWVQEQSFLGQPLVTAFASNGDFVVNALDNLAGSADLIGLRSRATFSRPFTRVEALRREADARFRQTEQALQAQLAETEQRLAELQAAREDQGSLLMSPEQQQEVDRFLQQQLSIRRELRSVRRELDASIENLGTALKVINIGLVPALLIIGTLTVILWRRRAMAERAEKAG
jgi:ABC-type uncharacterized transport system involved in gliding motility auxiliary subunit